MEKRGVDLDHTTTMPSFLQHALQRVTTYLTIPKKHGLEPVPLLHSSCFIVPTSIHINTPIQYHFVMPAHVLQPYKFEDSIAQTETQFQHMERLKRENKLDLKQDLSCVLHLASLTDSWTEYSHGDISSLVAQESPHASIQNLDDAEKAKVLFYGRREFWKNRKQHLQHLPSSTDENWRDKVHQHTGRSKDEQQANAISKLMQLADSQTHTKSVQLDIQNAFIHDRLNLAVVHAKEEPASQNIPSSMLVRDWCDRELHKDDSIYYTGWQMEDVGYGAEECITPAEWRGHIKELSSSRVLSEPDPPRDEMHCFHHGMVGGPVFADRGCIGMIEGLVAPKQTTSEQLGYTRAPTKGVLHISHEYLQKYITEEVEPKLEDRYSNWSPYDDTDTSSPFTPMDSSWRYDE